MKPQGFAAMSLEKRQEIASKAGKRAHALGRAHRFTSETAKLAGSIGGKKISADRLYMAEIGRRGGLKVSEDRGHMRDIGRSGGAAPWKR